MLRAVVTDLHLGQAPGDEERFTATLAALERRGVGEVVLLGDTFRALVGFERFWDETVRAELAALAVLRGRGVRVVMVEGNRDFFLDSADLRPFRDSWGPAHSFAAGGRRFLLEHGDLVNVHDHRYRFWRTLSKSRPARVWARLLPRRLARRIVAGTEARLAATNFAYRKALPEPLLEAAARRHFAAGVDVVLWGHFHQVWRFDAGGRAAMIVPDWLSTGSVAFIDDCGDLEVVVLAGGQFVDSAATPWYQVNEARAGTR